MIILNYLRRKRQNKVLENIKSQFSEIGKNPVFSFPFTIKNPKYMKIGDNFYMGANSRLEAWDFYEPASQHFTPQIEIGNNVRINGNLHIGAINKIIIGNDVLMGNGVFITDHAHGNGSLEECNIPPNDRKLFSKGPVIIGDKVWIGEHVTILPGVSIGEGCIIGAGAVVTRSLPPFSIAAGVPAIVKKMIR